MFLDGSLDTKLSVSENTFIGRLVNLAGEIERHNVPECIGVVIEKPFGQFRGMDVMQGMFGVAIHTCTRLGMPWEQVHLATVKKHATGSGKAKKPDMQAAAMARWGKELGEDEADAAWIGAVGLDNGWFK